MVAALIVIYSCCSLSWYHNPSPYPLPIGKAGMVSMGCISGIACISVIAGIPGMGAFGMDPGI